jgi:hypothetical protein
VGRSYREIGTGVTVEQRRSSRYEVQVPVVFGWVDESGKQREGAGFTRDISKCGVFTWCDGDSPPRGTTVHIELLLRGVEPTSKAWRVECTGRVVRVIDDFPGSKGFAATLDDLRTGVLANGFRRNVSKQRLAAGD